MTSMSVKAGGLVSLLIVFAAYLYKRNSEEILRQHLDNVLSGLLRAEEKVHLPEKTKVAVGFGSCVDVFSDAINILEKIGAYGNESPEHFNVISDLKSLEKGFAYFFQHGAAAERYVDNSTFFEHLVEVARTSEEFRHALGGNAPVMANRFHMEGCDVMLGSTVSDQLLSVIDPDIEVVGDRLQGDDIHLIMEYARGKHWGKYTAPRANRYIVHNDDNNPKLKSLDEFASKVLDFSPHLLVVGGLQMLDNFPFAEGERLELLGNLKDLLTQISASTRIHFEMASFAEEECLRDVIENVVYFSDSLGMNEQELPNLHSLLTNGSVTLISDPHPRIATTLDHMRTVYKTLRGMPQKPGQRELTRLHVHTLAYQAIMTTKGSSWKNSMSATAKASLVANRHVCGSNDIGVDKARLLMDDSFQTSRYEGSQRIPFQPNRPVSCWDEDDYEICLAPVLVCTDVKQTAGGGDNISSAGLVLQI